MNKESLEKFLRKTINDNTQKYSSKTNQMKGEIKANAINEIKQILKRIDMSTEEFAREFLKKKGYYVDNLWCIDDIQDNYECAPFQAMGILDKVLRSEWLVSNIFEMITNHAEENNFKKNNSWKKID